jgi:hypothetical protein
MRRLCCIWTTVLYSWHVAAAGVVAAVHHHRSTRESNRLKRQFINTNNMHVPLEKVDVSDSEEEMMDDDSATKKRSKKENDKKKDNEEAVILMDRRCLELDFRQAALNDILNLAPFGRLDEITTNDEEEDDDTTDSNVNNQWPESEALSALKRPRTFGTTSLPVSSPQVHAWQWLLQLDSKMSTGGRCVDPIAVTQRYALAVLYYSTGGEESWINNGRWLLGDYDECDWNRIVCQDDVVQEVTEIDLCKYYGEILRCFELL